MFKKMLLASAIYITSNLASAGTPYVGGSVGWNEYPVSAGPIGTVFGGYGVRLEQNKRIYLGGELNATAGNYTRSNMTYTLGASFMPGVMVTDETMIYTRLGVSGGHTDYRIAQLGTTNSRYTINPLYGLGVQTKFTEKWDLRGEYTSTTSYKTGVYSVGLVYKFS